LQPKITRSRHMITAELPCKALIPITDRLDDSGMLLNGLLPSPGPTDSRLRMASNVQLKASQ
jgi:hypothetical protein